MLKHEINQLMPQNIIVLPPEIILSLPEDDVFKQLAYIKRNDKRLTGWKVILSDKMIN